VDPATRHQPTQTAPAPFESLLARGLELLEASQLDRALATYQEALNLAEEAGDETASDRAFVNLCSVRIPLSRGCLDTGEVQRLREILLRGTNDDNCFLAAYDLALIYEYRNEYKKGLFYARVAVDRAEQIGNQDWLASSRNQVGNMLAAESRFEQATATYRDALALVEGSQGRRRAAIQDNLGYSLIVSGQMREGLELAYRSLRTFRRLDARRDQILPHLTLAYAHLELERYRDALTHAGRALAMAEEAGEDDWIKNALYLLGEAACLAGDSQTAHGHFSTLQHRFFAHASDLPQVLMAVDVRSLINLRA
jgi:tetratricopeptide (TPR) repeat protein